MQDTATTQSPAQQPQSPKATNPSAASLAVLKAALTAAQKVQLVTPEENAAIVKAKAKEAKKLLKQLRGDTAPVTPATQQLGMGTRVANANITPDQQRQIDLATAQFKQSVERVDNQILAQYIQAIQDGDYSKAEKILQDAQDSQQQHTLEFALLTIGAILLPLYAKQRLQSLFVQFGLHTVFAQTTSSQEAMRLQAKRGATSHVKTIAKDIKNKLDQTIDDEITNPDIEASVKDKFEALTGKEGKEFVKAVKDNEAIYAYVRQQIISGNSRQTVITKLQENFGGIGKARANVIAGNEANRVFTMSQFDADQQFLAQNKLTSKAYKRLVSNTGTPEAICKAIIDATALNPIPFKNDFIPFGTTLTVDDNGKTRKLTANYEKLQSGHIHVNCHCRYELLIKNDDGSFLNTYDGSMLTLNDTRFNPELHPRAKDGKFGKGSGIKIDLEHINTVKQFDDMVAESWLKGSHGKWDKDVVQSVRNYQGHAFEAINTHARALDLDAPLAIKGQKETTYGKTIENINKAGNLNLATDKILYRGTEIPFHQVNEVGETIDARSFISTTIDKKKAKDFQYKGGSFFIISAKKGQKVIIPDLLTYDQREPHRTMGEAEVLMTTDSKLTITRIDGDKVYAELS